MIFMEIDNPIVSVIIPTYNRAYLLKKSITSVLNQTYADLEVIIVDDGSTDNSEELIKSFDDNRIRYIKHDKNKGVSHALNTGIRTSRGKYISFLGSDDVWLPQKLEKELEIFQKLNSHVGVVYSGLWQIKNNKKIYVPSSRINKKEGNIHKEILLGNFVNGLSLIREECFEKVGLFDVNLPGLVDWDLYIRVSKFYEFRFVDEPLIIAPLSDDSISVNSAKIANAYLFILEKYEDDFNQNKNALASIYGFIGSWLCIDGKLREGRKYFIKSIKLKPLDTKSFFALISSFFGSKGYKKFFEIHKELVSLVSK